MVKLPISLVAEVYEEIEDQIAAVSDFVRQWFRYQTLWDLNPDTLYNVLGPNLSKWLYVVTEIKEARNIVESNEDSQQFGNIIVKFVSLTFEAKLIVFNLIDVAGFDCQ